MYSSFHYCFAQYGKGEERWECFPTCYKRVTTRWGGVHWILLCVERGGRSIQSILKIYLIIRSKCILEHRIFSDFSQQNRWSSEAFEHMLSVQQDEVCPVFSNEHTSSWSPDYIEPLMKQRCTKISWGTCCLSWICGQSGSQIYLIDARSDRDRHMQQQLCCCGIFSHCPGFQG